MSTETKIDPFKPVQPHIPGVPEAASEAPAERAPETSAAPVQGTSHAASRSPAAASASSSPLPLWVALAVGIVVVTATAGTIWWARRASARLGSNASAVEDGPPVVQEASRPAEKLPVGPGEIATTDELSSAWSSKRFIFRNPITAEDLPAIAVRLPGGALWGISLLEPYGNCELAYVTNLAMLRSKYNFAAQHPMVINPCDGTIYDLARYGSGPNGLVRGEIVQGAAVRPPIGIEIVARGNRIVAVRVE